MKIYLVGGAVRDQALGREAKDLDYVVVGATPEEMIDLGYRPIEAESFPVFLDSHGNEYALARKERKVGDGYKGFDTSFSPDVSLEEDLIRRDLTINAMAMDLDSHEIIDPFGGLQDLKAGLLRHTSEAFVEDPLRLVRCARFAAKLDFNVADETMALLESLLPELQRSAFKKGMLSSERIFNETSRALETQNPRRYFEVLQECGALAVLFPELAVLKGIEQPIKHHPEICVFEHIMLVLDEAVQLSTKPEVRFAALVHDLGKGATDPQAHPRHIGHEELGVSLVEQLCNRLKAPKTFLELSVAASRFHIKCHTCMEMKPGSVVSLLEDLDAYRRPERFQQFLLVCTADAKGRLGMSKRPYPQAQFLNRGYELTAQVQGSPFVAKGLKGAAVGAAIHQERARLIRQQLTPPSENV